MKNQQSRSRTAADINNVYTLAAREDAEIQPLRISAMEFNYLDKRDPRIAFIWSALMPGLGQIYYIELLLLFCSCLVDYYFLYI